MKKVKLITEVSHDIRLVEAEGTNGKELFVEGIFSTAEVENNNKRKYKKGILEREVANVQKKVSANSLWGELGHPPNPEINLDKIAIKVESLQWKGDNLMGKAKVLDTPQGNIAKTLIKEGSLGISSRGLGTVGDDGYVNDDFNLITWDLVADPSNNPSWVNGIYEGKQFEVAGEEPEVEKEEVIIEDEMTEEEAKKKFGDYLSGIVDNISKKL